MLYKNRCSYKFLQILRKASILYFPVNFAKFWRAPTAQNTSGRLLLKSVYIFEDSIAKKLSGYLLTKKIRHKHLSKECSFSGEKINSMTDHVKPTLQEINPDYIILHAGNNDLKTEKRASQIAKARIDLVTSLKKYWSIENVVTMSGIAWCLHELNNEARGVNDRSVQICKKRNIAFLSLIENIDPSKDLN